MIERFDVIKGRNNQICRFWCVLSLCLLLFCPFNMMLMSFMFIDITIDSVSSRHTHEQTNIQDKISQALEMRFSTAQEGEEKKKGNVWLPKNGILFVMMYLLTIYGANRIPEVTCMT